MVHSENALFHQSQRSYPVTSSRPVLWHKVRKVFLDRFPVDLQQQMVLKYPAGRVLTVKDVMWGRDTAGTVKLA